MSDPFRPPPMPKLTGDDDDAERHFHESPRSRAEWADAVVLARRAILHRLTKDAGLLAGVKAAPTEQLLEMLKIDALEQAGGSQ